MDTSVGFCVYYNAAVANWYALAKFSCFCVSTKSDCLSVDEPIKLKTNITSNQTI